MSDGGKKRKANVFKDALAGGAAGCLEVTIMYPTEYIKTQLQLQPKGEKLHNGMIDCAVGDCLPAPCAARVSIRLPGARTPACATITALSGCGVCAVARRGRVCR